MSQKKSNCFGDSVERVVLLVFIGAKATTTNQKKRVMEAKGGEVRRLHIIYFLSHMGGRAEHPHLIRVLHLARNGVYLRGKLSILFCIGSYYNASCS